MWNQKFLNQLFLIAFGVLALGTSGYAQQLELRNPDYQSPETPWGQPDLQGVWDRRTITPLERPARFEGVAYLSEEQVHEYERLSAARDDGRPLDSARSGPSVHDPDDLDYGSEVLATRQTSLVVDPPDGRIPAFTKEALQRTEMARREQEGRGVADSWEDRSLQERCITWGIPAGMLPQAYNNNIQIVQTPDTVMIMNEMVHDIRLIPLWMAVLIFPEQIRQWHGDPRGYWEGETLVVESTNFSAKTSFRRASDNLTSGGAVYPGSRRHAALRVHGVMIPPPGFEPWTVSFPMTSSDQPLYEFACHEGNYGLLNILRVARALERQEQEQT